MFRTLVTLLSLVFIAGCDGGTGGISNQPPSKPVLEKPVDGATGQLNAVALQWMEAPEASNYVVQASTDPGFEDPFFNRQGVTRTWEDINGLELGKPYYWRVRAGNEFGWSDWSESWKFTPSVIATPPGVPALAGPENGREDMPTTVNFSWRDVQDARSYHLQVSVDSRFIRNEADLEELEGTQQDVVRLVPTYTYFWRVRARNPAGFGPWSPIWRFVVL